MVEALLAAVMLIRARRLVRALGKYAATEAETLQLSLLQLRISALERHAMLRPYRRAWRYYRHPLAAAYRESRRRRKARL